MKRQTDITQFFKSSVKISSSSKAFGSKNETEPELKNLPKTKKAQENKSIEIQQFINRSEVKVEEDKKSYLGDESGEESESEFSLKAEEEVKVKRTPTRSKTVKENRGNKKENKSSRWDLPLFLQPEHIRDKNQRRPDDPDYDNSTIFVPSDAYKGMTATVKQYWQIKQNHRDKVVFFKLGKFYEIFNEDAILCHKLLDLNWTGPLHVGFPEKCLEKYGSMLVNQGIRVVVAEQMETPKDMQKRLKQTKGPKEKTIKREVCQVLTKGTFIEQSTQNYDAKYLLAVYTDHTKTIGICILDIAALSIKIGQFDDNAFWYSLLIFVG